MRSSLTRGFSVILSLGADTNGISEVITRYLTAQKLMGCDLTMPDRSNESYRTRREILDAYYSEVYQKYLFERDLQGMGIRYFERAVEKFWKIKAPNRVLEIGGGQRRTFTLCKLRTQDFLYTFRPS